MEKARPWPVSRDHTECSRADTTAALTSHRNGATAGAWPGIWSGQFPGITTNAVAQTQRRRLHHTGMGRQQAPGLGSEVNATHYTREAHWLQDGSHLAIHVTCLRSFRQQVAAVPHQQCACQAVRVRPCSEVSWSSYTPCDRKLEGGVSEDLKTASQCVHMQ
jgi:hypothetical protein